MFSFHGCQYFVSQVFHPSYVRPHVFVVYGLGCLEMLASLKRFLCKKKIVIEVELCMFIILSLSFKIDKFHK